jgi:diguanylate cyclase (GGDEF)-like protein
MSIELERRRLLIAAAPGTLRPLAALFSNGLVEGWEAGEAESFEQARFLLQHDACEVVIVDHSLHRPEDEDGLNWLLRQQLPVVYLAGPDPAILAGVVGRGFSQWLPRDLALRHPALLTAVLGQAASCGARSRERRHLSAALRECRQQSRRLLTLLWGLSTAEVHPQWFTQRHMMERLQEELARSQRYDTPLCVALGELVCGDDVGGQPDGPQLAAWAAERVARCKRRTDVAGQYGPRGFILLLAHTPLEGAVVCCRRLRKLLEEEGPAEAYFGISRHDDAHATAQGLLGRAEEHLERAKCQGSDRVVL